MVASSRFVSSLLLSVTPIVAIKSDPSLSTKPDYNALVSRMDKMDAAIKQLQYFTEKKEQGPGYCKFDAPHEVLEISRKQGETLFDWSARSELRLTERFSSEKHALYFTTNGALYGIRNPDENTLKKLNALIPFPILKNAMGGGDSGSHDLGGCREAEYVIEEANRRQSRKDRSWIGEMIENNKEKLLEIFRQAQSSTD